MQRGKKLFGNVLSCELNMAIDFFKMNDAKCSFKKELLIQKLLMLNNLHTVPFLLYGVINDL